MEDGLRDSFAATALDNISQKKRKGIEKHNTSISLIWEKGSALIILGENQWKMKFLNRRKSLTSIKIDIRFYFFGYNLHSKITCKQC